jgi:uncharacterized protein YjgD (DUF1641 family)
MKLNKVEVKTFDKLTSELTEKMLKNMHNLDDLNSKLESTDNYLSRYLPFNTFCQIMDAFRTILIE